MPDLVSRVEWLVEEVGAGCVERSFLLHRPEGPVPGVLWSPGSAAPQATVLLFHGGSGHKRSERHLRMGSGSPQPQGSLSSRSTGRTTAPGCEHR